MAAAVIGALVGSAGAAFAAHQFSDVPNSHPFHDEISAIAGAGITTGFDDGTFRPGNNVTRQAMAAFMQRGLGRVDFDGAAVEVGNGPDLDDFEVVAVVEIEAGATGGGNGFVAVEGSWMAFADSTTNVATACPCEIQAYIWDLANDAFISAYADLGSTFTESGYVNTSGSVSWVSPIEADGSNVFALVVGVNDADVDEITVAGTLTAIYVPFGAAGTNEGSILGGASREIDLQSVPRNLDRRIDVGR